MTITPRTGFGGYLGIVKEDTWNVYKAPTRFLPIISGGMKGGPEQSDSEAFYAGLLGTHEDATGLGNETYKGDFQTVVFDHGDALLNEASLGANATGSISGGLYPHVATPGEPLPSYCLQFVMPDASGVLRPRTYTGAKCESFEFGFEQGKIITRGMSWSAAREILVRTVTDGVTTNTSTAITSASAVFTPDDNGKPISGTGIPAGATMTYVSATAATLSAAATATGTGVTFTIGVAAASVSYASDLVPVRTKNVVISLFGTVTKLKSLKIRGDNKLTYDEGRNIGSPTIDDEQVTQEARMWDGDGTARFRSDALTLKYKNGDLGALSVVASAPSGSQVTWAGQIKLLGESVTLPGRGVIDQPLKWQHYGETDAEAITITANNPDSAA